MHRSGFKAGIAMPNSKSTVSAKKSSAPFFLPRHRNYPLIGICIPHLQNQLENIKFWAINSVEGGLKSPQFWSFNV